MKCDRSFVLVHASFEFLHVHGTEGIKKLPNSSINVESIRILVQEKQIVAEELKEKERAKDLEKREKARCKQT